ncbi:fimbrial biogenesis outer membrane usher protein [Enterobacter bugandensis]
MLRTVFYITILLFTSISNEINAKEYSFDTELLGNNLNGLDIEALSKGKQLPGTYQVKIFVNENLVDSRKIKFSYGVQDHENVLLPCLSTELLKSYGIKTKQLKTYDIKGESCNGVSFIPFATSDFDFNKQELSLFIPPSDITSRNTFSMSPVTLWDNGLSVFRMNYRLSDQMTEMNNNNYKSTTENRFAQVEPGLNWGAWRFRNMITWQSNNESEKWQNAYAYVERGMPSIRSRVKFGDYNNESLLFDSLPLRGVTIATDDVMTPYEERDFFPTIRGVAYSRSSVDVLQFGYVLYHTIVPAGPFEITDLPVKPAEGNIQVVVTESNGKKSTFSVPFVSPPVALHQGYYKYSASVGMYRPSVSGPEQPLQEGTIMYGLPLGYTFYSGLQHSDSYSAVAAGVGKQLGNLGAISLDTIDSKLHYNSSVSKGHSNRIRYRWTGTGGISFWLNYRKYSKGYKSFGQSTYPNGKESVYPMRSTKSNLSHEEQIGLSWSVGRLGNLSLDYTNSKNYRSWGSNENVDAGYSVDLPLNISLFADFRHEEGVKHGSHRLKQSIFSFSINVPMKIFSNDMSASYTNTMSSDSNQQLNIRGSSFDHQANWSFYSEKKAMPQGKNQYTNSIDLNYKGAYGELGGNYTQSNIYKQYSGTLKGGVSVYNKAVILSQLLDNTNAIVEAPGASNVPVGFTPGNKTDFRGYAIVNGLSPYQENIISLDPVSFPKSVSAKYTELKVVPTEGAMVLASFKTKSGLPAFIKIKKKDGASIPFGSVARLRSDKEISGIIGNKGIVYLTGLPKKGVLDINWKNGRCSAEINLPDLGERNFLSSSAVCI